MTSLPRICNQHKFDSVGYFFFFKLGRVRKWEGENLGGVRGEVTGINMIKIYCVHVFTFQRVTIVLKKLNRLSGVAHACYPEVYLYLSTPKAKAGESQIIDKEEKGSRG